jgi:membrane-bound lytic murein transglycosylase D
MFLRWFTGSMLFCALTVGVIHFAFGWSDPKIINLSDSQTEEGSQTSTVNEDEVIEVEKPEIDITQKRPWQPPNFANQNSALGWAPDAFKVPAGLEERVQFWKSIYTQYTTDQGVLHDSLHVAVVYGAVDFRDIASNKDLSEGQKRKARRQLLEDKKKEIRERLLRLSTLTSGDGLTGEDLKLWNTFATIDEADKFKKAMHRKRLRFQLGQSDRFLQGIYYAGRYLPEMESIFRQRGLPIELTRLPFVESSFNIMARSRVGASGIWQFMRYTGRRFMRIHYAVDERNDPIRATESAARLFKMNYDMLGKWPLAITGYNHGPAGVQRVVKKFNTDNIVELVDERNGRFGFASANFFACFLAALEVEKEAVKYFGDKVYWAPPVPSKEIKLARSVNKKLLLKWYDGNEKAAKDLNGHLLKSFWLGHSHVGKKDFIRVPPEKYELAMQDLAATNNRAIADAMDIESTNLNYYMIGQGETLSEIASQLGVSVNLLIELNGIENPRFIRAGQKLQVPPARERRDN